MVKYLKIAAAAAATLLSVAPVNAEDANSTPTIVIAGQVSGSLGQQSDPMARAAAFYGTYQKDVGELQSRGLNSVQDVDNALNTLAGQNPAQLSRGWIAYAGLVASQSPELRTSVREVVAAYGSDGISSGMVADSGYVRRVLSGGTDAVSLAFAATTADTRRLDRTANYFREQAYSLQAQGWAKTKLRGNQMNSKVDSLIASARTERAARGTMVTAFSSPNINSALQQAGSSGAPSLWDGVVDAAAGIKFPTFRNPTGRTIRRSVKRGHEATADKIATLAAFRIIGVDSTNASYVRQTLGEGPMRGCVSKAQLNINQCVAANSFPFETVDCIGKHAIGEVSECFAEASN